MSNGTETNNIAAGISGAKSDTYNGILTAGTWTLTVSFNKDDASRGGDDLAYISGLTISGIPRLRQPPRARRPP